VFCPDQKRGQMIKTSTLCLDCVVSSWN